MNNEITVVGAVNSEITYSHDVAGEEFYTFKVGVRRESGIVDTLPIIISKDMCNGISVGKCLAVKGKYKSYNLKTDTKSKLLLNVSANQVELIDTPANINDVFLEGVICKLPLIRETPKGRKIGELLLAVSREQNKTDYIPCIVWENNIKYINNLVAGDTIRVAGRVQSREYTKDGKTYTAYEVSVELIEEVFI